MSSGRWKRYGLLFVGILVFSGCSDRLSTHTATPAPTTTAVQVAKVEATPTQDILWPTEGWQLSTPEDQGLDSTKLDDMSSFVRNNIPAARSILVVRNGYLVYEDYIKGEETSSGPIWSATKSVLSALIGIALEDGHLGDIDDKLVDYLGEYVTEETDPRFDEISLRHLLTMTAGFPYQSGGSRNLPASFREELVSEPGQVASYSSTSTHLLSGILQEATGLSASEMANDRIFKPLGISEPIWSADAFGINMGGYGLYLTPRDMAKFGYLYLNEGHWEGEQIIPTDWVKSSTMRQAEAGLPEIQGYAYYGYLWWVIPFGEYDAFAAFGAGGQNILVVPEVDLIIVTTTDTTTTMSLSTVAMRYILPAIKEE